MDTDALADRQFAALRESWTDGPPEHVTLGTFRDAATLQRWHPDHTLGSHRALVDALVLRFAAAGIETMLYEVTDRAYERWRGSRADTPENRAKFIGQRGVIQPYRLGIKMGYASRGGVPAGAVIGWCAFDLSGGPRPTSAGVLRLNR